MKYSQTIITILAALISAFSPAAASPASDGEKSLGLKVVTIDPGHGGHDAGCISRDGRTKEKDLALSISKKLASKIRTAYPDVKVIMTRDDDTFIPLTERANIANRNNSDLFICIHINAASSTAAKGFSVHVLGQSSNKNRDLFKSNMELCKRENSVILLEDDQTSYQGFDPNDPESYIFFSLMQNTNLEQSLDFADDVTAQMAARGPVKTNRGIWQNPFWVLWKTTMPAVLIECGFISNSSDLAIMKTDKGREGIAEDIFRAFKTFKKDYDESLSAGGTSSFVADAESQPASESVASASESTWYGLQVIATPKKMKTNDPFFKGHKPHEVKVGNLYKYILGESESLEGARANVKSFKSSFPGAFMVKVENGETSIAK